MDRRPVNLNLFTIHFPIPAIVSILHRLSGVFVFLMIPALLWLLEHSLRSENDFQGIQSILTQPFIKLGLMCFLLAFGFHFLAGLRHLMMDAGVGESKLAGRATAWMVLGFFIVFVIILGISF
jgi:succinate dehydrogenase / fumarate reductase cytochrome b subunit